MARKKVVDPLTQDVELDLDEKQIEMAERALMAKSTASQLPPNVQKFHLVPLDKIGDFEVRPGFYNINGATAIPGGVNFTVQSSRASEITLLLFHRGEDVPFAELPFPEHYKIGHVYSMIVFNLSIYDLEYAYRVDGPYLPERGLIFDKSKILLDPYAKAVAGQRNWGEKNLPGDFYRARVVKDDFDWKDFKQPLLKLDDLIIYELHVRGFTKDPSSKVTFPGTFEGLREKIPYLLDLGVNAVELMPIFEFDEMLDARDYNGHTLYNYWGYNTVSFFSPNSSYTAAREFNREGNEFKELVKELNENGIEVILDVVFNHTAEGNEQGKYISFKGFDNNIYYLLTPQGFYYNFSGCGNTLNCNNPIVQQLILECLRYWVITYRVDGFRFDLASILGRNEDGSPMSSPPLLQSLAYDPILGNIKLIAEAWDAGGLYQVGSFPSWNDRWAEWNGRYRDDLRRFLKGDEGLAQAVALRMMGSPDLYSQSNRRNATINFITCHDGFTLYDLYAYNEKHNEANGWGGSDGSNDNYSWNCGEEGESENPEVVRLRMRMIKNACAALLSSRGAAMFLAGDEFCNTQYGNNNPYCQDNRISWLDWKNLKKHADVYRFFKQMIRIRRSHPALRKILPPALCGLPSVSLHGVSPWKSQMESYDHYLGVMFAGLDPQTDEDDILYVGLNSYWENIRIQLPEPPRDFHWEDLITTCDDAICGKVLHPESSFIAQARSVSLFIALPDVL